MTCVVQRGEGNMQLARSGLVYPKAKFQSLFGQARPNVLRRDSSSNSHEELKQDNCRIQYSYMADKLSKSQCILLAVNYASESQIQALHQLVLLRTQELPPELVLRIVLTYLPGVTPPSQYTDLIAAVTAADPLDNDLSGSLDTTAVNGISSASADKRLRKLTLLPLSSPSWPTDAPDDTLTRFLCHRAYRIDQETGLITLVPDLVRPFLQQSEYLRLWFISVVLPLLRLQHEYFLDIEPAAKLTLEAFEKIDGYHGTDLLLSGAGAVQEDDSTSEAAGTIGRDLKGLVGPWLYGHTSRKRRRLNGHADSEPSTQENLSQDEDKTGHSWEHVNKWLVRNAAVDFQAVTSALDDWDGPIDVDLGGYANSAELMHDEERAYLERRYAQAAIACCYAVEANTEEVVRGAHGILSRLADLLDFVPPPDLATSVEQLPHVDGHMSEIHATDSLACLDPERLLDKKHALTEPTLAAYMLLQMLVYSAYQLLNLGHPTSITNVTKLRFFSEDEEQLQIVKKILHGLSQHGKRDEEQWMSDRAKLLWLWNWNIDPDEHAQRGSGPFGDIPKEALEKEILVAMLVTGNLHLVEKLYICNSDRRHRLSNEDLEEIILNEAMRCYDNASNGNKNRGNMKKADDITSFFLRLFPDSLAIARASALIQATHTMSFYSLTLQHGVPFQPVAIRASSDSLSLLELILEQNQNSYTKLDDLINIGRNLAVAAPEADINRPPPYQHRESKSDVAKQAERRVIYMCISAALSSGDFDTAYSYLTSRLQPTFELPEPTEQTESKPKQENDDVSWRAAFLAGRTASPSQAKSLEARIRRLEQRTELLSLALMLAPTSALTEILGVYRRVEEEMTALLAQQAEEEEEHDSMLDRQRAGQSTASVLPGGFGGGDVFDGRTFNQTTRTVGNFSRGYNSTESAQQKSRPTPRGEEEAPVGLFDLARGAASALGRNAFPLRTASGASSRSKETSTKVSPQQKQAPFTAQPSNATKSQTTNDDEGDDWGAWGEDDATAQPTNKEGDEEGEAWGWNEETTSPRPGSSGTGGWGASSFHSEGSGGERRSGERVRRRDMVANAVTGGLASGIGWVLGATPVEQQDKNRREGM
ncbi:Sec39-like protein [Elsinoe fawcettii]|nr:Sec39-like protein [Elsinoe fawcettii]